MKCHDSNDVIIEHFNLHINIYLLNILAVKQQENSFLEKKAQTKKNTIFFMYKSNAFVSFFFN